MEMPRTSCVLFDDDDDDDVQDIQKILEGVDQQHHDKINGINSCFENNDPHVNDMINQSWITTVEFLESDTNFFGSGDVWNESSTTFPSVDYRTMDISPNGRKNNENVSISQKAIIIVLKTAIKNDI
jgi:hypothetical protein